MQKKFMNSNEQSPYKEDTYQLLNEIEKGYPVVVKNEIYGELILLLQEKLALAEDCDSPIEFLLGNRILHELDNFNSSIGAYYYLHVQPKIHIGEDTFKVDFLLAPVMREHDTRFPNLIIECDGHDYHEKTKEQAKRDKRRDRKLQSAGYRIMRFTGSEIYSSPHKCVRELFGFLRTLEEQIQK